MGLDGIPAPPAFRPSWAVPLCTVPSCDLLKRPAPTPIHFPPWTLGGTVLGLFHISGLSMRHLPSGERDQEFDILNPKQLLPGLLQIHSPAACRETHGECKAILILAWLHWEGKNTAKEKTWSHCLCHADMWEAERSPKSVFSNRWGDRGQETAKA